MSSINPTTSINTSFSEYVRLRELNSAAHIVGGVPDYAFDVDCSIRRKINAVPAVYPFFKALTSTWVPRMKQQLNMGALKVGPNQYPGIYNMAADCADRLGIGIPTVFIEPNPGVVNAYAYATTDESPLVVLTSAMLERFQDNEIKAIIGHECGHIHNNHGIYTIAAQVILGQSSMLPVVGHLLSLVSMPLRYMIKAWSRAAEVTCDRAAVICSDSSSDMLSALSKLTHSVLGEDTNIEALLKQYEALRNTPVRYYELEHEHPAIVRRLFAVMEFQNSEVLYGWRPEFTQTGASSMSKSELDARCERYVSVVKNKGVL